MKRTPAQIAQFRAMVSRPRTPAQLEALQRLVRSARRKLHRPYAGERCACGSSYVVRDGGIFCRREGKPALQTCVRCHDPKPLGEYQVQPAHDGRATRRHPYCCECRTELVRLHRRGALMEKGIVSRHFSRWHRRVLLAHVERLIAAAREARSTGTWTGKEGVRAYAALGEALEPFKNNLENPDAIDDAPAVYDPFDPTYRERTG